MIYLITGQPGHGKTLRAMELAVQFKEAGREVYAHGVKGLKYAEAGFHELADPRTWEQLPDGSVILLDECYSVFPTRSSGAKVPAHVDAMARHRHRGFDFILIAQQASKQIDGFLLGLIETHEHVRRKSGAKAAIILWWDRFTTNVKSGGKKKIWVYPRALMKRNLYDSTSLDTTKRRIPMPVWAIPLLLITLFVCVKVVHSFFNPDAASKPGADSHAAGLLSGGEQPGSHRPDDLVKWLKPRIEGQPWTAPAYDGRPVASEPRVFCMAVEDGRCNCITEQGTDYAMDVKLCRSTVAHGAYDPTRKPVSDRESKQATTSQYDHDPHQGQQQTNSIQTPQAAAGVGQARSESSMRADYVPPEDMPHLTSTAGYVGGR